MSEGLGCWLIAKTRTVRVRDGTEPDDPVLEVTAEKAVWFRELVGERFNHAHDIQRVSRKPPTKRELELQDDEQGERIEAELERKRLKREGPPKLPPAQSPDDEVDEFASDPDDDDDDDDDDPPID